MNRVSATNNYFQREKLECLELSQKEIYIARLIAWGYTQKEIAAKLFRSELTIATHLKNIYQQLGIHKETDLTRWYIFREYSIADNPFKKVLAIMFLVLSLTMVLDDQDLMRFFRISPMRTAVRAARPVREKRYRNVFELQLATA